MSVEPPERTKTGPELFFGLVGPIGTDMPRVATSLSKALASVSYDVQEVRIISLLKDFGWTLPERPVYEYYMSGMDAGNKFRQQAKRGDALAAFAMHYIRKQVRENNNTDKDPTKPVPRLAYILRSLKHPDEVVSLRQVYGPGFFLIGAFSPKEERRKYLAAKIAADSYETTSDDHLHKADLLIARDEKEQGVSLGQDVRGTFPTADFFVDASAKQTDLDEQINRFVRLLFGHPFETPTVEEFGMFHAHAAALRSSAMGRQVGASLLTQQGELVAVGTNEVPKAGGGHYWGTEKNDKRDFQRGGDSTEEFKRQNLAEALGKLKSSGWLSESIANRSMDQLVEEGIGLLKGTRVMNPLEYGRAVHAEMSAMMDAARRGVSVKETVLFTTTFPCHECARHIIAAGIRRVYFIEPYPKSLAPTLHDDSLLVEGEANDSEKVILAPLLGVAPRMYPILFAMSQRKDDLTGKKLDWKPWIALPRLQAPYQSYFDAEESLGSAILDTINKMDYVSE